MTKTIKLSLAAVMAAGIATSASAQSLEDAIKGVEVSGYVDYRLENKTIDADLAADDKSGNANEYAVNVTATSKVNDMVKATLSLGFDEKTTANDADGIDLGKTANQDADPSINVSNAYFTFDLGAVTLMAGKQNIPSAFVDKTDTAKSGAGIVALSKINDSLTVAAAHFMNNNISVSKFDIDNNSTTAAITLNAENTKTTELVAMVKAGIADVNVNYNMTDIAGTEETRYSVNVKAAVAGINADFRHSVADSDLNADKGTVTKLALSTKVGAASLLAGMATTGADNKQTNDVAIDRDNDADVHLKVWQFSTLGLADAQAFLLGAGMPVADKLSLDVKYAFGDADGVKSATELLVGATYKMSKNFTVHGRYSIYDVDMEAANKDSKTDYSRIQVKYTF